MADEISFRKNELKTNRIAKFYLNHRRIINRSLLFIIAIVLLMISLFIGPIKINLTDLISLDKNAWFIMSQSRIPRSLAVIVCAVGLSFSGLIMQSLGRNKFISPSTAGTTSAAALGAIIASLVFTSQSKVFTIGFSFVFSMVSTGFFLFILQKIKFTNTIYIPLVGIMYGAVVSSISIFLAHQFDITGLLNSLNTGSFTDMTQDKLKIILILIVPIVLSFVFSSSFNIVGMGESFSQNLGVNYTLIMFVGLVMISIISAVSFVVVGPIPFLGLIVPNIVSYFYGDNLKKSLVDVGLMGVVFVLASDIIAQIVIRPFEISISVIMGIIGALIFLVIIFWRKKK